MSEKESVVYGLTIWGSSVFDDSVNKDGIASTITSSPHSAVIFGYKVKQERSDERTKDQETLSP